MTNSSKFELLNSVEKYYSEKIREYGATSKGVDWNGEASQILRFDQLTRIVQGDQPLIGDLGCGYGAYFDYLKLVFPAFRYQGIDVSAAMIDEARRRFSGDERCDFSVGTRFEKVGDYVVASGIFNVRLEVTSNRWLEYILETLHHMNDFALKGFAFNCLTSYSDAERMKGHLYYADPCYLFDYCKKKFSKNVSILHDYGLYEFTILVRKDI